LPNGEWHHRALMDVAQIATSDRLLPCSERILGLIEHK
jgi:hypothetical protein